MIPSASATPYIGGHRREKPQTAATLRSKSQPPIDSYRALLSPLTGPQPMRNFFEALLRISPHRFVSISSAITSGTKLSSSSISTNIRSDLSSHFRLTHPSIVSSLSVQSTNVLSPKELPPARTRLTRVFRRAANLILFSIYWCKMARKKNLTRSMAYQSYLQSTAPAEKYLFDKSHFKTRSIDILPKVQEFFKQPTGERDIDSADEVRKCLEDIKPFSRLPKPLQDQILQHGWYECYQERRTIVRQGERPACFYIILSGYAIPTYKRATDDSVETLDLLGRGCTFGEKGLMTSMQQTFTVMSKTKLELLVLWKDDFKAIYMGADRHCSKEDLRFLKSQVPILRGCPIERLNEFPHAIQRCNFKHLEVVARDSRRMKHIYVVKKGSMAIWKRLDPSGPIQKESHPDLNKLNNDENEEDEATGDNRTLFSEIRLSGDVDDVDSNGATIDADFRMTRLRRSPTIGIQRISSAISAASGVLNDGKSLRAEKKFPGLIDKRDRLQLIDYDSLPLANAPGSKPRLALATSKRSRSIVTANTQPKMILPDQMVYVHVKTLNEGQHFGLTDMLFPNQPALTLISNECECLLLLKSSFIRIASDQYKQNLRRVEIPFPTDADFYKTFHTNEVWKRYSKQVYTNALDHMHQQRPKRVNARPLRKKQQPMPILIGAV